LNNLIIAKKAYIIDITKTKSGIVEYGQVGLGWYWKKRFPAHYFSFNRSSYLRITIAIKFFIISEIFIRYPSQIPNIECPIPKPPYSKTTNQVNGYTT